MGLFGEIEPVPYRLLDELEAQMEANRERLDSQQDLKGMTRPRPQRSIFNANMSSYRRPEPAAHPRGGGFAVAWLRYFTVGSSPSYRLYSTDGSSFVDFNLDAGYLIPYPAGWFDPPGDSGSGGPASFWWVEGTGDNGESFMGTRRSNPIRRFGRSASGVQQIVLPAGGDRMIVVFRARSLAATTRASSDETSVTTRYCEVQDGTSFCTTDTTYTITQMPRVDHLLQSNEQTRAFYVTRSTVVEVDVSPSLRFYSDKPDAGNYFIDDGNNLVVATQGQFIFERVNTLQSFGAGSWYTLPLNSPERRVGVMYHDNNTIAPIVANGLADFSAGPFQSQGLLREPRFGTLAALAYLASGGDEMVGNFDYADVPIGFPVPPAYYSAEYEEAEQTGVLNIKKVPIRPTTIGQVIDTSNLAPRQSVQRPEFADGWDGQLSASSFVEPLVAWDYGRAGLTRSLLNTVGFSTEPLNP